MENQIDPQEFVKHLQALTSQEISRLYGELAALRTYSDSLLARLAELEKKDQ